jgi:DNA repair photolyase
MMRHEPAEAPDARANETRTPPPRGRGAVEDLANRFTRLKLAPDSEGLAAAAAAAGDDEIPGPATRFFRDVSRSVVSTNDSPDLPFDKSFNPFRGCEHGCIYCYARPTHEYFGLSPGLDFETRIFVKEDAPQLLRAALMDPKWEPTVLALSGVTDCYQPIERTLRLTRRCLEVLAEFRQPTGVVTKSALVLRDLDLLGELARHRAAAVFLTITTLDLELAAALEPRASRPARRLEAVTALARAGIPAGVMIAPVIPGLTDHEIPAIVAAAAQAGACSASWQLLRLPHGVKELFQSWLERHRPGRREKVLSRIRGVRGGKLSESRFGLRMRGEGEYARQIDRLFRAAVTRAGLHTRRIELSGRAFRRPGPVQGALFPEA